MTTKLIEKIRRDYENTECDRVEKAFRILLEEVERELETHTPVIYPTEYIGPRKNVGPGCSCAKHYTPIEECLVRNRLLAALNEIADLQTTINPS